jgi:hypothetical protein
MPSRNYSSRFAGATAGAAHIAATRLRGRLARIAAAQINLRPEDLGFADLGFAGGRIFVPIYKRRIGSFAGFFGSRRWEKLRSVDAGDRTFCKR